MIEITTRKVAPDGGPEWVAQAQHPEGYPVVANEWTEADAIAVVLELLEETGYRAAPRPTIKVGDQLFVTLPDGSEVSLKVRPGVK